MFPGDLQMRRILIFTVFLLMVTVPAALAAAALRDIKATLRGAVLEEGLARVGEAVKDGAPLVYVRTVVGRGVAARASADGVVVELLVRPGQVIEKGMVVVRLDSR